MSADLSYGPTGIHVEAHQHTWHAWADDRVWRCTSPTCGAWISRLCDRDGNVIPLPKDRR